MKLKNSESGRSMVEMMGYMAVVMVLSAGIGNLITRAYGEYKMSKASIQLTELSSSIVRASAVDPTYEEVVSMVNGTHEDDVKNREGRKLIPSSFRLVGRQIFHAFGGKVSVAIPSADIIDGASDKFSIAFEGLTRDQCIEMAVKDWSQNKVADLFSVVINNEHYWYWPIYKVISDENVLPVSRAVVAGVEVNDRGQCSREKNNIVMWVFN